MNFEDAFKEFDAFDDEEIENISLDIEVVRKNIPTYESKKLCEIIVCDRYLGISNDISTMCMEELAQRRINGDNFDFETFIEESIKSLPPLDFTSFDIRNIIGQAINRK